MISIYKHYIIALFILISSSVSAYECNYSCPCDESYQPSWGSLSVGAEYLYWQPTITGMSYALTHTNVIVPFSPFGQGPGIVPNKLSIKNVDFDYGPGYRVYASYTLPKMWTLETNYTNFEKKAEESVQAGNGVFIDTFWDAISATNPSYASAALKVKLQKLDASISRSFNVLNGLKICPNFGMQYFRLDTQEQIKYIGSTIINSVILDSIANVELINNSEAYGVLFGLDVFWSLLWDFELFGKTEYGISRASYSSSQKQQTFIESENDIILNSTSKFKAMQLNVQTLVGLNWSHLFKLKNCPIELNIYVGYEMNIWLQNIQLTRVLSLGTGYSDANTTNIGNVSFRGLVAGASLSF